MKSSIDTEIQNRMKDQEWGNEIAGRVFRVKRHRKNILFAAIAVIFSFSVSVLGLYQNSTNSSLALSARNHFEIIFTQEVNYIGLASILEE